MEAKQQNEHISDQFNNFPRDSRQSSVRRTFTPEAIQKELDVTVKIGINKINQEFKENNNEFEQFWKRNIKKSFGQNYFFYTPEILAKLNDFLTENLTKDDFDKLKILLFTPNRYFLTDESVTRLQELVEGIEDLEGENFSTVFECSNFLNFNLSIWNSIEPHLSKLSEKTKPAVHNFLKSVMTYSTNNAKLTIYLRAVEAFKPTALPEIEKIFKMNFENKLTSAVMIQVQEIVSAQKKEVLDEFNKLLKSASWCYFLQLKPALVKAVEKLKIPESYIYSPESLFAFNLRRKLKKQATSDDKIKNN